MSQQGAFIVPLLQQQTGPSFAGIDHPPARVRLAAEFLHFAMCKNQATPVVGEGVGGIEVIDGQELTTEEETARATAANLLSHYFAGKYVPAPADKVDESKAAKGVYMRCIACAANPALMPGCKLCGCCGDIVIYPATAVPDHLRGG